MRKTMEHHPVIGHLFVPRVKARIPHEGGGYIIATNRSGFRCAHDFVRRKPAHKRRVLLFGDSFTAGDGVSNGYRFGDHLEKAIGGLEVYNFGIPGTGTDQHYLAYREYARDIEHDLLVIAVFVENIRRVASRYRWAYTPEGDKRLYPKPYYTLERGRLQLGGVPVRKGALPDAEIEGVDAGHIAKFERFPRLKRVWRQLRDHPRVGGVLAEYRVMERLQRLTGYQPVPEWDDPTHPAVETTLAILEHWIREDGGPALIVPIPLHHHVLGFARPNYRDVLQKAATRSHAGFWDPLPDLLRYDAKLRADALHFRLDGHLTKRGHEVLAHHLAPVVERMLPRPHVDQALQ
jgi:lysophospholipase L1-like esterase